MIMTGLKIMSNKIKDIENYLDSLFPNPKTELNYNKDYEFLIAVMLSAQTKDVRVNVVTEKLFSKYKTLKELSNANIDDVTLIVRSLGNYKNKSKAVIEIAKILDSKYNGKLVNDRCVIESLPMCGRKTCNVVLSTLFNEPCFAVDTHVFRVSKRLSLTPLDSNTKTCEEDLKRTFSKDKWSLLHLRFVLFGRYYCTSKKPNCSCCKLKKYCIYEKRD